MKPTRRCGVLIDMKLLNYTNDGKEEEEEEEGPENNDEEENDDEDKDEDKDDDEDKNDKEEEEEEVDVTKLIKAFQNLREMREKLKKAPSAPEFLHAINDIVEECDRIRSTNLVFHGSMKNLQDSYEFADRYYNLDMTHWGNL